MDVHWPEGAPADLFITEELDTRSVGSPDFKRQARAIETLAMRMADDPGDTLPEFVDLAMKLTGAASAGLSLLDPSREEAVFEWCFLHGSLREFDGATTPRNYSPCGITLDWRQPVLSRRPERAYSWIADADIEVPEVLLVPLYDRAREPFGTLWVVADGEGRFTRDHARLLTDLALSIAGAARDWRGAIAAGSAASPASMA